MRYLVTARVKPGRAAALADAIDDGTLGRGSVAGDEYLRNMAEARRTRRRARAVGRGLLLRDAACTKSASTWEEYFMLEKVQDAHARSRCRDLNGTEPWSCGDCDCTARLEAHLARKGSRFR